MVDFILLIIVILGSSFLGLFIYHNNPKSATNRLFSLFATSIVFWAIIMYLSLHQSDPNMTLFYIRASMLAATILTTCALLLSLTIPSKNFSLRPIFLYPMIGVSLITMITAISPYMFTGLNIEGTNIQPTPGPGIVLFLIPGLGYSVLSVIFLVKKFFSSQGIVRKQLRFVLFGLAIMFILIVTTNFILVIIFKTSSFIFLGPFFTLTFLSSTAYAITRHRLLEIRSLVARTVTYTLVSALTLVLLTLGLLSIAALLPSQWTLPATVVLSLLLAYFFAPASIFFANITSKLFHKKHYVKDQLLEELSEQIRSKLGLNNLTKAVMKLFSQTISPTEAAFFLIQENNISVKNFDFKQIPHLSLEDILLLVKKSRDTILVYEELDESKIKTLMKEKGINILVPLKVSGTVHGVFVLGEKSSGEIYSNQDLSVLEIFGPQISIAIQNSLAYDEIKEFNVTLREKVKFATKDLRKANKHLRELDKLKDEFVYIATHELKTPVTVIKGYLSMIEDKTFGEIPEKIKEPLEEIKSASQQLQLLVNDILDIARSESQGIKFETKPTDLCTVISDVVGNLQSLAKEKGLDIKYNTDECLMVVADPDRLKEVVNNLLTNAIKYSTQGEIQITHGIDDGMVITHIKDQGFGMSEADQKKLFTRFFRSEQHANDVPGTGLGLFIVKQLVEKMGGRIWFTSKLGIGTTFSFSLKTELGKNSRK